MRFLRPTEINSFIGLLLSNTVSLINVGAVRDENEFGVSFWDFIRSQLSEKLIATDYRTLINVVVNFKNQQYGLSVNSQKVFQDVNTTYCEFMEIFSIVSIFLHLSYGIKLNIYFPKMMSKFYCESGLGNDVEDKVQLIDAFPLVKDLEVYKNILQQHSMIVVDVVDIDYEFLSRQLLYFKYSQEGIACIGRDFLC